MSAWPIDDDTAEPETLLCPGCDAVGDAPCAPGCVYAEPVDVHASEADAYHDEQASSDADPPDPWKDIF